MPVARVDVAVRPAVLLRIGVEPRDLRGDRAQHAEGERGQPEHAEHAEQREQPELADTAPLWRAIPFSEHAQSAR